MARHHRQYVPPRYSGKSIVAEIVARETGLDSAEFRNLVKRLVAADDAPWCALILGVFLRDKPWFQRLFESLSRFEQEQILALIPRANAANRPFWCDQILREARNHKAATT